MKIFPIVFACDSGYIDQTSVALFTMCKFCKTPDVIYKIYYLNNDFSISDKEHLLNIVKWSKNTQISLEFIKLENFHADRFYLEEGTYITLSTYYRLIIPIIFKNYNHLLYVDSDMVFLRDPYELATIDMGTNVIAGVSDRWVKFLIEHNNKHLKNYLKTDLNITDYHNYINAGVVFFNLAQIRKVKGELEFLKSIKVLSKAVFQDQCCINYAASKLGGVHILDHHFNIKFENELWVADVLNESNIDKAKELAESDYIGNTLIKNMDDYISKLPNINRFIHYLSKRKPWNHKPDYVNQVWWGAVFALPNPEHYINRFKDGYDEKYVKVYEHIAKTYFM